MIEPNSGNDLGYGLLRITVRANARPPSTGRWWQRLARRQLSHHIVQWAHHAGLPMAMVYRSHLGFIDHGPIIDDALSESPNPEAMVTIEIMGATDALHSFLRKHHAALAHACIHFLPTERWSLRHPHKLQIHPTEIPAHRIHVEDSDSRT